jgi:chromate transporter
MNPNLVSLALIYGQLSLLAFGGGNTILPDMQRQVVEVQHWMSAREFAALYALAQAAPGPNMIVCSLIGWRVAGLSGAVVAMLGICVPSGILTFCVSTAWIRFRDAPWRIVLQSAITPVTAGLVMAAAVILCQSTAIGMPYILLSALTAGLVLGTKLHPLLPLGAAAALGALGIIG